MKLGLVLGKKPKWWNWYTRTTQNRVAQAMRVRISLWAPRKICCAHHGAQEIY
ncbi:MAG: hypothetical protein US10_C0022G0013 [Candidatus Moranbacteria bacterium GW2011_GWD2_36_198]|nr:MAG: hypothetical protein US10_C0022G0013 [Candidatus Moranbacteria bacterium GW2011_GWD2_36_198]